MYEIQLGWNGEKNLVCFYININSLDITNVSWKKYCCSLNGTIMRICRQWSNELRNEIYEELGNLCCVFPPSNGARLPN